MPWALVIFAFIIVVGLIALVRPLASQIFYYAAAPLLELRNAFGATEVATLKAELAAATAKNADRDLLAAENTDLAARLGRATTSTRILAGVLLRPPYAAYDNFVIDIGSEHGLKVGDLVFGGGNTLLGEIAEVDINTARVSLYSAPGIERQALVVLGGGTGRTLPVNMTGQGSGSFTTQVPAGTDVKVGDPVVFAGVGGGLAAKVSAVAGDPSLSFEKIYLHLPVNIFELRFVEVAKK